MVGMWCVFNLRVLFFFYFDGEMELLIVVYDLVGVRNFVVFYIVCGLSFVDIFLVKKKGLKYFVFVGLVRLIFF